MKKTVSKKVRVIRNLLLLFLVLAVVDFLSGLPFPFLKIQFRREERANLVGPGEILGMEDIDFSWCKRMIVAETEEGAILWVSGADIGRSKLAYREKNGGNLLMAAPGSLGYMVIADEVHLPLVLFDDETAAVRAEIRFTLKEIVNGEEFVKTYELSSERSAGGYFLFTLNAGETDPLWMMEEGLVLQIFANIAANQDKDREYSVPVQVRFFDAKGDLIAADTISVCSEASDLPQE